MENGLLELQKTLIRGLKEEKLKNVIKEYEDICKIDEEKIILCKEKGLKKLKELLEKEYIFYYKEILKCKIELKKLELEDLEEELEIC